MRHESHPHGYMLTVNVDREDGQLVDKILTGVRKLRPDGVSTGLAIHLVKRVSRTIPELEQMISKRAWKVFAGLSQRGTMTLSDFYGIYFDPEKRELGQAEPDKVWIGLIRKGYLSQEGELQESKLLAVHEDASNLDLGPDVDLSSHAKQTILKRLQQNRRISILFEGENPGETELLTVDHRVLSDVPLFAGPNGGSKEYLGAVKVIETKDGMPGQLLDRQHLRVASWKDKEWLFEQVPEQLRKYIDELGLNIVLPAPLNETRTGYQGEDEYREDFQRTVALAMYYAFAEKVLHKDPSETTRFSFEGFPQDWEISGNRSNRFDEERDQHIINIAKHLRNGEFAKVSWKDLQVLVEDPSGSQFVRLILALDIKMVEKDAAGQPILVADSLISSTKHDSIGVV